MGLGKSKQSTSNPESTEKSSSSVIPTPQPFATSGKIEDTVEGLEFPALPLEDRVLPDELSPGGETGKLAFDSFLTTSQGTVSPLFNVISLRGADARRSTVRDSMKFTKMNFRFHITDKDPEEPLRGSVTSHRKLYQKCVDSGAKWIAVCEDNLCAPLRDVPADYFDELREFMDKEKFDIIYLAAFFTPTQRSIKIGGYKKLYRAPGIHGAMCYIISNSMCRKLLDIPYRKKGIDIEFLESHRRERLYMYRRLLFYRSIVKSTQIPHLDKIRNVWFRHPLYTRCEDRFFENSLPETTAIAALILVILLFIILWLIISFLKGRWLWWS